jgi:hypothetical protein
LCFNHISALKVHKITNLNCGMNRFKPLRFILELASRHSNETDHLLEPSCQKTQTVPKIATGSDLERVGVVAQSTLSQILAGKRGVSKGTAKKLGAFFGASSAVFL